MKEFWIVLDDPFSDKLADRVYEAGFDDSALTTKAAGKATIAVFDRQGDLPTLIDEAVKQAAAAGLTIHHVELPQASLPLSAV